MLALAFSFSVFLYWMLLGRAVVAVAYPRCGVLRAWLIAPALGLSIVLLGLMVGNQLGWPIARFATAMTVAFGLIAAGVLVWRRPKTPWRVGGGFLLAVVFALFWAGWPALESGFNWISYANDDMANYCLAAQRFMDHGFYDVPTMADLAGRDYPSYYFFMHVSDMMRFGAEHLVAWGASIAHLKATQSFMPMILALGLTQIAGAGAIVLHTGRWRKRALVTVWLLAASPLFMLGTLYQLIAQVGGIALLLTTLSLLTRPWVTARRRVLIRYAILPSITAAALCIFYPEVTPFVALTFVAFATLWALRHRGLPAALLGLAAYVLVGVLLLLRHNLISYVSILVVQFNGAMDASNLLLSLFPYFMLPTGFSNLFGWMPIAHDFPEPIVSVSIAAGMLLAVIILARSVREAWRLTPAAILLLIQFTFAARLFKGANDFGLYKLAMWMQPVLAAGLAGWLLWLSRRRAALAAVAAGLYVVTAAPTALYYAQSARGMKSGGLTELRLGSRLGLSIKAPADTNAQLTSTIENVVAAKFAASELRGRPLALVSRDFFWPTTRTDFVHPTWPVRLHPHFDEMAQAVPLITARNRDLITAGTLWKTQFSQPVVDRPTDDYISLDPRLSLFNKFYLSPAPVNAGVFVVQPAAGVHNQLLFVHSGLGNHYYLGDRRRISFFQQEQDLFAPGHDFNGIGRFMLLRIENPSDEVYLRIAATRTLVTGRTAWKPMPVDAQGNPVAPVDENGNPTCPVVHGEEDLAIGTVGNGAFNLFVGPLKPKAFEGAHYLAIDFAEYPRQLKDYRTGLKQLYNQQVPLDYRRLLGWARDISAVSVADYAALQRPRVISKFPEDLALARSLEFAGAYEDGWLSPQSKFILARSHPGELVRVRGVVPLIPGTPLGTGQLHIRINGVNTCKVPAALGTFDWLLPIPKPAETTKVELAFDQSTPLPGRDQRPAGAKLELLGLVEAAKGPIECDYSREGYSSRLASTGIDQDGWMGRSATILLPASDRPLELSLQFEYPVLPDAKESVVIAQLAEASAVRGEAKIVPGQLPTLQVHLPASPTARTLRLETPLELALPAPDTRLRSVRLLNLRLTPAPSA